MDETLANIDERKADCLEIYPQAFIPKELRH
jgi:hypothetical protein